MTSSGEAAFRELKGGIFFFHLEGKGPKEKSDEMIVYNS